MCDDDVVELSNLHRQVQFVTADVGRAKAEVLGGVRARFTPDTADALAGDAAVIVDGSDDPATKFAVGDWAMARGKPHVIAGVLRWGGTVFSGAPGHGCYRCLFEEPPDDAPSCGDAGVIGPACAVIGGLAARAALALVAGDLADAGSLLAVDDLRKPWAPRRVRWDRRPGCPAHPS